MSEEEVMRKAALITLVVLTACDGPPLSGRQREQVYDIAEDVSDARFSRAPSADRDTLERIEKLEGEVRDLKIMLDAQQKIDNSMAKSVDAFAAKYNRHLETMH